MESWPPGIHALVERSWRVHEILADEPYIVAGSMPILFFGDLHRYWSSETRVVTVGLNPSRMEFPEGDRCSRFAGMRGTAATVDINAYLASLGEYFRVAPYRRWFDGWQPLLEGLDCGHYDGRRNAALHTDLCSPLATDPTWARLTVQQRRSLEETGIPLWHDLVSELVPDVLFISVARRYLDLITFPKDESRIIHSVARRHPYALEARILQIGEDRQAMLAFGRAAQTPFGSVAVADKRQMGIAVAERLSRHE